MKTLHTIPEVGNQKKHALLAGAIAAAVLLFGTNAWASDIVTIEGMASGSLVTLDSNPIITSILSQPGTFNERNFYNYSFLAQDSTGSIDIYGVTNTAVGYTPLTGDAITLNGKYSPFHQIPEIGTVTSISATSSGNAIPAPSIFTVSQLNQTTLPQNIAGYLVEMDNVGLYTDLAATIPASGVFPNANTTYYVKDGSSASIMALYFWVSSYSTDAALIGTPIPTGTLNIQGFMSVYPTPAPGMPEFTPTLFTAVPEPSSLALVGLGLLSFVAARRRQR